MGEVSESTQRLFLPSKLCDRDRPPLPTLVVLIVVHILRYLVEYFLLLYSLTSQNFIDNFVLFKESTEGWLQTLIIVFYLQLDTKITDNISCRNADSNSATGSFSEFKSKSSCVRVWRTAAVLVEVIEWVDARLLLLVRLERVAGLEIGVLHGRDPAGPGGKWKDTREKPEKRNGEKLHVKSHGSAKEQLCRSAREDKTFKPNFG